VAHVHALSDLSSDHGAGLLTRHFLCAVLDMQCGATCSLMQSGLIFVNKIQVAVDEVVLMMHSIRPLALKEIFLDMAIG